MFTFVTSSKEKQTKQIDIMSKLNISNMSKELKLKGEESNILVEYLQECKQMSFEIDTHNENINIICWYRWRI